MKAAALGRLLVAELRGRRLRAMVLLFFVVVLSTAALVTGLETQNRAGDLWDRAFAEANGAHVTVSSPHADVLRAIARDPRVVEASKPTRTLENGMEIRARGGSEDLLVREMGRREIPSIARPLLRDGRWVREGARDEIVIDRAFALERHVRVGDRVVVRQAGRDMSFTVVGRAVDLVDCFYPLCDPVPAWVDPAAFARFAPGDAYGSVFLRVRDPQRVSEFVTDVENRYGDRAGSNDWRDTRDDTLIVSGIYGAFLAGFGVFVMVAAAVVVLGSMASRVIARRRDIGLLKAIGVTPRQVAGSVVVAHTLIAAVGVLAGWLVGGSLSGRLQLNVGRVLGGDAVSFPFSRLVVAFVVIEAIVVAATVLPALRTGRLSTTAALAPATGSASHRSRIARTLERIGAGPVTASAVRDAFARPARAFFTVLALAIAIVAVVVSAGFNRTLDTAFTDSARTGDPYDVAVAPRDDAAARLAVTRALERDHDVTSWFTTTERHGIVGDSSYLVRALGGDVAQSGYVVESGRLPRAADEAIAGYGFLDATGTHVGDRVKVTIGGSPQSFRIVGWYSDTEDTGQLIMVTLGGLRRAEPDAHAEAFFGHVRGGVPRARVEAALQRELRGQALVSKNVLQGIDEIDAFRATFWLFTAVVLVVAFANLASTMLLAVRERIRDVGVLRSVGFTPRQVFGVSAIGASVLGLVAAVVGVPVGWALLRLLMKQIGSGAGVGPNFGVDPATAVVVSLFPVTLLAAAALGTMVTRRAARSAVSDLVRYE